MEPFTFKRGGLEFGFTPLIGMTEAEVLKLVPEYAGKEVPPYVWTVPVITKTFKAADLRTYAKGLGLSTIGTEAGVAQRLLDAGFDFNVRK